MKPTSYGPIYFNAKLVDAAGTLHVPRGVPHISPPPPADAIWKRLSTLHEGEVLYSKQWNFFVRASARADTRANLFFANYETASPDSDSLLRDAGFPWRKAETEEEVWSRIGNVWTFLREHVSDDGAAYAAIATTGTWPSIQDYARYYVSHGNRLVWAACFSKAHLFATLLGRVVYPRYRFAIALTHHTEGGAPPTAEHVYVAAYVADRWFYFDATAAPFTDFPAFADRRSIGVDSFTTVDYQHPFDMIPVPLSGFDQVPYLPV
jgi:hypothetical protein